MDHGKRLRRPGGVRSIRLGDLRVSFVPDGAVQGKPRRWLPDTTAQTWTDHPEYLDASGHLVASIGGLLVEHGDRALLIDAGFGPQSWPAEPDNPNGAIHGGALLDSLASLGRKPVDIEAVAFTHLHVDHVGWAPAFADAEGLVPEPERVPRDVTMPARVRTVADGDEIFPGVHVRITGGHTVGHAQYVLTGGGTRLIAFGDALHSPIQVDHPEWSCVYDHDPAASADHRRRLLAELEAPDTIGFGNHFADVVFGRVRRDGEGPAWRPLHG